MTAFLLVLLCAWARAQAPEGKRPPPRRINLMEADLSDPELRALAAGLSATFQLLTRRQPKPGTTDDRARASESQRGAALMAECSGSFLP